MTIDDRIKEIKGLILTILQVDVEKGVDTAQTTVPKLTNDLVQLYRQKNGFSNYDGKGGKNG